MAKEEARYTNLVRLDPRALSFLRVCCPASPSGFVRLATKSEAAEVLKVTPSATAELTRSTQDFAETTNNPLLVALHESGLALFRKGERPLRLLPGLVISRKANADLLVHHLQEALLRNLSTQAALLERLRRLLPTFGTEL